MGKELLKVLDGGKAADLALFGRMLADLPDKNRDAACQVAHAISTSKVGVEFDFYTAMDDLKKPEEEAGAGMMGTVEYNSACFYRYANLDSNQLQNNVGDDRTSAKNYGSFIHAAVNAVPLVNNIPSPHRFRPSFVFAVVRDSAAWSSRCFR